ncbi:MAG: hypothetical protein KQI81_17085 [Deltaproteobacteria bacterium]|nr:hypothetical protein [Deltaproteobacteria bacterium]
MAHSLLSSVGELLAYEIALPAELMPVLIDLFIPTGRFNPMETRKSHVNRETKDVILSMVKDRPCTIRQITNAFSNKSYEVVKLLSDMVRKGQVMVKSTNEGLFVISGNPNL